MSGAYIVESIGAWTTGARDSGLSASPVSLLGLAMVGLEDVAVSLGGASEGFQVLFLGELRQLNWAPTG